MAESTAVSEAELRVQLSDHIAPSDYARLMNVVYEGCGIQLNESKKLMVETRLRKRLRATGARTFREYWKLLNDDQNRDGEWIPFINAITTNKTDFFREPVHFDYLVNRLLPELGPRLKAERRPLLVWSAGSSSGKEAYTLAMVLRECQSAGTIPRLLHLRNRYQQRRSAPGPPRRLPRGRHRADSRAAAQEIFTREAGEQPRRPSA